MNAQPPAPEGGAPIAPPPVQTSGLPSKRPKSSMKKQMKGESEVVTFLKALLKVFTKDPVATFLLVSSVILTILFFSLLGKIAPSSAGVPVPLSEVTQLARDGNIKRAVLLDHDSRVIVQTEENRFFWAAYPRSDAATNNLLREFNRSDAEVVVNQQAHKGELQAIVQFLIPILLLVALFAYFSRLQSTGGADSFSAFSTFAGKGKKKGKGTARRLGFGDVAGAGDAVTELREIRDFLADPGMYERVGAKPPRGVLLVGPPGTGKTLLAKATAGEADATFFSLSGSDFVESLVGVGAARVRDLFAKARKAAPSIIFIDEIDAAGRKRGAGIGQGNDEREQTLNALLVELDGFDGGLGLIVMAATNRPDVLDPALLRPGRFDRQITVDVPDVHGRHEILQLHAKKKPLAPGANLEEIARLCPGFSGAELANVINESSLLTVRQGEPAITQATMIEAIDRVVSGPASNTHHLITEHERWIVAIHEASHAVVTRATGATVSSQKVSIVSRGRKMGTAATEMTDKEQVIMQTPDMYRQLCVLMGGLAGEQLAFGTISTGVGEDLHVATDLARRMITSFGMSEEVGLMTVGEQGGEVFLGASLQELGSVGPTTLDTIDKEIERLVNDAAENAMHVLRPNWAAVENLANALVEHETLAGVGLEAMLAGVRRVEIEGMPSTINEPAGGGGQHSHDGGA
ncbi:MAG: ATP-dependent zinc metalloprotease FtsH [Thermoleophilaceae bacterium]|nr:ATP-dependent zinc metalloprotease FtsH [Thermoleophilaceae bacterium]